MSKQKLRLIKIYLKKHLNKKFIETFSTFFAFFILFVKKSNDDLKFCVNYRKLNEITKKNRYSISLIVDLMIRIFKIKYLTKIDIRHVFNRIRLITKKNENLITFRIRFESYKYLIFSFELTNEFVTFQNFINDTLMNFLNKFVIIYLNDIFIYNDNLKKHKNHVRKMFQKLREIEIQIDIDKCEFHKTKIKFLKIWINKNEIRMNSIKMIAINEWKISQNLQQIQSFFDFVNFYRRFIKKFSIVIKSLIRIIKKNTSFEWSFVCQSIFIEFKKKWSKFRCWFISILIVKRSLNQIQTITCSLI